MDEITEAETGLIEERSEVDRRAFLIGVVGVVSGLLFKDFALADPEKSIHNKVSKFVELSKIDNDEVRQRAVRAFAKAHLIVEYARSQDWPLSARFMHHFLYGKGESMDLSREFQNDYWKSVAQSVADNAVLFPDSRESNDFLAGDLRALEGLNEGHAEAFIGEDWVFQGGPAGEFSRDIRYSLHYYRITIPKGSVVEFVEELEDFVVPVSRVQFPEGTQVRVEDRYDWSRPEGLRPKTEGTNFVFSGLYGQAATEETLADVFRREVDDLIDLVRPADENSRVTNVIEEYVKIVENFIREQDLEIFVADAEMALLADLGIAQPFDVRAAYVSPKPIEFLVRKELLE